MRPDPEPQAWPVTLVWTMPGRWSRRCSRVAAMSISLAPARHTLDSDGAVHTGPTDTRWAHTGTVHTGPLTRCWGLRAQRPNDGDRHPSTAWPGGAFRGSHRNTGQGGFRSCWLKKAGLLLLSHFSCVQLCVTP